MNGVPVKSEPTNKVAKRVRNGVHSYPLLVQMGNGQRPPSKQTNRNMSYIISSTCTVQHLQNNYKKYLLWNISTNLDDATLYEQILGLCMSK